MKYYLYNPLANNGIKPDIPAAYPIKTTDISYPAFFAGLKDDDEVVLVGGDGTINYLVNHLDTANLKNKVYILSNGTGNDFLHDIGGEEGKEVLLNPYLVNLPTVQVNGLEQKFINNMGFGIDGYCCEVADQIKEKNPNQKINYTSIAIKGLLFHFKPCHAWINVDGTDYEFDNVWIAPTMKGRYYGGGMMMAPDQDRNSDCLSVVIYMSGSKLKALKNFPSIFEGKHLAKTDMVKVITGRKVHVRFSRPCAAQIDGETVLNVTEYKAELS